MVDNQHKKITGYRDLTQDEIDLMNEAKALAVECGELINKIEGLHTDTGQHAIDMRWLNIGKTDLQKGFMSVVRSVAKPETF